MSKARVCAVTALYGDPEAAGLSKAYSGALYFLGAGIGDKANLDVICGEQGFENGDVELDPSPYPGGIEHARNNCIRLFLQHPRAYTHALLWDSDVKGTPLQIGRLIARMLKLDKPIISVPYLQKNYYWKQGAQGALDHLREHPEAKAEQLADIIRGYSARYVPDFRVTPLGPVDDDGLAEQDRVPVGFALIKREVLEKMTAYYADSLGYDRAFMEDGKQVVERHVGLFHTTLTHRKHQDEDYAFCERWKAMAGRMYLYVGEGSPLEHIGHHPFKGTREAMLDAAFWARNQ
jgi:hypothetical protein